MNAAASGRLALTALAATSVLAVAALALAKPSLFGWETARNVIQMEAAGVKYTSGKSAPQTWPELSVHVNGEAIGTLTIDSEQQKAFSIDVPNSIERVAEIAVRFTNESYCRYAKVVESAFCRDRKVIVRGLSLNGEPIEGGVPSGEKNTATLLQTSQGGITWQVDDRIRTGDRDLAR